MNESPVGGKLIDPESPVALFFSVDFLKFDNLPRRFPSLRIIFQF